MANNLAKGLVHGLASLIGMGSLYDPVGDLQNELTMANQNLVSITTTGTIAALNAQVNFDQTLLHYIQENNTEIQESMDYYNQIGTNKMQQQNYFISTTIILVFIIIFFMIIKKN